MISQTYSDTFSCVCHTVKLWLKRPRLQISSWNSAEEAIVAPAESSEKATAASSKAADEATDEGFDAHLQDSVDGINWTRLP
jgi:hypothetical protein